MSFSLNFGICAVDSEIMTMSTSPSVCRKDRFALPKGVIYLDGNSLGPLPLTVPDRLAGMVKEEWGESLIRGWRLGRTLFVGDAGMYSAANLQELSKGAGRYILATPIRRIKEIKDEVLSHPGRYADIAPNLRAKEVIIGDGERRRRYTCA